MDRGWSGNLDVAALVDLLEAHSDPDRRTDPALEVGRAAGIGQGKDVDVAVGQRGARVGT